MSADDSQTRSFDRREFLKRAGIGILITDHAVRETLVVTDRAYIINNGRIFRAGSPEALQRDPEVKRIYLGESFSLRV
jgi:lipopolysaccharide export system ATP-binding protein